MIRRTIFSLSLAFVAMTLVLGCKPQNQVSQTQSLENFAAGNIIKRNYCAAAPDAASSDVVLRLMKTSLVEGPQTLKEQVQNTIAAVPKDYLELFDALGGRVIVTAQVGTYCDPILNEITGFKEGLRSEACYQLDPSPESFAQIVVQNTPEAVGHHLVREFGLIFSQILSKANVVVNGDRLKIQSRPGERTELVDVRRQLMEAFLRDVTYSPHFSLETLQTFIGGHAAKIAANIRAQQSPLAGVNLGTSNLERLTDFVFAESFDSYFCNAEAPFDPLTFALINPSSEDLAPLVAALKRTDNSRMIMSVLFGESFGVMSRLHATLFGGFPKLPSMNLVESCNSGFSVFNSPVTNLDLYGGAASDERTNRSSPQGFGSAMSMELSALASPTLSGSRFFESGLELAPMSRGEGSPELQNASNFGAMFASIKGASRDDFAQPISNGRSAVVSSNSEGGTRAALQQQVAAVSTTMGKSISVEAVESAFALAGPGDAIRKCVGEVTGSSKAVSAAEELAGRASKIGVPGAGSAASAPSKFANNAAVAGSARPSLLQAATPSSKPVGGGVVAVPGTQARPIGNESSLSPAEIKFREEQWELAKKLPTIDQKYGPLVQNAVPSFNRGTGATDVMANFRAAEKAAEDAREFARQARAAEKSTAMPNSEFNQWTRYSYHQAKVRESIDSIPDPGVRQRVLERYQEKLRGY